MSKKHPESDPVRTLRELTLEQVETRLAELDGERASLAILRRSLVARHRAEERVTRHRAAKPEEEK